MQGLEIFPRTGAGKSEKRAGKKPVVPLASVWWKSAHCCLKDSALCESSSSQREGARRGPLAAN